MILHLVLWAVGFIAVALGTLAALADLFRNP